MATSPTVVLLARSGALLGGLVLVGAEVLDALLKGELARPPPSLAHPVVAQAGGHATAWMAVYGALAYLTLTLVRSRPPKAVITAGRRLS